MFMARTIDMTTGNPMKHIVRFTIPLFLGNVFQQLYNMADSAIVGQKLGVEALTSVGQSASITFLIIGFCMGTCAGFGIPISQRFGARDQKTMRKYVYNSLYLSAVIAAILTVICCALTRQILQMINTPAVYMDNAYKYLFIIFLGLPCTVLYNIAASIARAIGDSKTPFVFLVLSAVLNVGLDFLFIFGFGMGVEGAAIATVISQGVSGLLCLARILTRYPDLRVGTKDCLAVNKKAVSVLLKMGIPMGLQSSITAIGSILLQIAINSLEDVYIQAYTIAIKVKMLFIPMFDSLGTAMATYMGQNYGAGNFKRIKRGLRDSVILGAGFTLITMGVIVLIGRYLIMIFVNQGESGIGAVIDAAYQYIFIDVMLVGLLALLFIFRYSIQGIGRSLTAMAAGFMEMASRLVMSLFVIPKVGWLAACFTDPLAWGSAMIYCMVVFLLLMHTLQRKHRSL